MTKRLVDIDDEILNEAPCAAYSHPQGDREQSPERRRQACQASPNRQRGPAAGRELVVDLGNPEIMAKAWD